MIHKPFSLFAPFSDQLRINLLTKEDEIHSDDDAARALGIDRFASAQQVHGKETAVIHAPVSRIPGTDGLITDVRNITLLIRVADCQSFVIYDPVRKIAGVLHAGWKGLVCGAIPSFFEILKRNGSHPSNVFVGCGPSLCEACAEFTDPLKELPGIDPQFFQNRHVDLRGIADQQLLDAGVQVDHCERVDACTKCQSDEYWSYRGGDKERVQAGLSNVLACTLL